MRETAALLVAAAALAGAAMAMATAVELRPRTEPWNAAETFAAEAREPGQLFPLRDGARLGEVELSRVWSDFRGQAIAAGRYELRYALQPRLKEHVGSDAVRDVALLVPSEAVAIGVSEGWIAASRRVSGSRHPAVMALVAWSGGGPPPEDPVELEGWRVVVRTIDGLVLAFVVEGRAVVDDAL